MDINPAARFNTPILVQLVRDRDPMSLTIMTSIRLESLPNSVFFPTFVRV